MSRHRSRRHRSPLTPLAALLLPLLATPLAARADTIATLYSYPHSGGGPGLTTSVQIAFGKRSNSGLSNPVNGVFSGLTLTPADVGQTFKVDAARDPNFNTTVATLTNGINDDIAYQYDYFRSGLPGGGGAISWDEHDWFGLPYNDFYFSGRTIRSIWLTLDDFTVTAPGQDPNHDGDWSDVTLSFHITLSDEALPALPPAAPLPAAAFGALPLLALTAAARRRRSFE